MRRLLVEQSSTITSVQDTYGLLLFGDIQSLDNYIYSLTDTIHFSLKVPFTLRSLECWPCVELSLAVNQLQLNYHYLLWYAVIQSKSSDVRCELQDPFYKLKLIIRPDLAKNCHFMSIKNWHVWLTVSWSSPSSFKAAVC